jgi:hypothetical protein
VAVLIRNAWKAMLRGLEVYHGVSHETACSKLFCPRAPEPRVLPKKDTEIISFHYVFTSYIFSLSLSSLLFSLLSHISHLSLLSNLSYIASL